MGGERSSILICRSNIFSQALVKSWGNSLPYNVSVLLKGRVTWDLYLL
jgi:hypothetical protein